MRAVDPRGLGIGDWESVRVAAGGGESALPCAVLIPDPRPLASTGRRGSCRSGPGACETLGDYPPLPSSAAGAGASPPFGPSP